MTRRDKPAGHAFREEESSSFSSANETNGTGFRRSPSHSTIRKSARLSASAQTTPRSTSQRIQERQRQDVQNTIQTPTTSRGNARKPPRSPRIQPPRRRKAQSPKKNPYVRIDREIRHYQRTSGLLIPRAPFSRLLRECLNSHGDYRVTQVGFDALQEAAEIYLTQLLEDAYRCTIFRRCVTLHPKDIQLVRYIRGFTDPTS